MRCPDPCEQWELRDPETIIERLLARSARKTQNEPEAKPSKLQQELGSYHHVMAASLFTRRADIQPKVPTRIVQRRKAALEAAANDPMLKTRDRR